MKKHEFFLFIASYILSLSLLGCKKRGSEMNASSIMPYADFSYSQTGQQPSYLSFQNGSLHGKSYFWNFGNGQVSTLKQPGQIAYPQPGEYQVVLSVTNGENTARQTKTVTIAENQYPLARFGTQFKNAQSFAPATVIISNESVNADGYQWEIDGMRTSEEKPSPVTFYKPGNYLIKLVATKQGLRPSTFEQIISVSADSKPVASFTRAYVQPPFLVNQEFIFVNQSKNSERWVWTFEGGSPSKSSEQHPSVKFTTPGLHKVTLTAIRGAISSDPVSTTLKINP